jgi:hypothetical protein
MTQFPHLFRPVSEEAYRAISQDEQPAEDVSDRWCDLLTDRFLSPVTEESLPENLLLAAQDGNHLEEVCFVAQRGEQLGVLMEWEIATRDSDGGDIAKAEKLWGLPASELGQDAIAARLCDRAQILTEMFGADGADVWVAAGPQIENNRLALSVFVPDGSPALDRMSEIASAAVTINEADINPTWAPQTESSGVLV